MADFVINYCVPRTYQLRGGKLVEGYETEFTISEFGSTSTVKTPSNDPGVVRQAIMDEIGRIRAIHNLSQE
jgi:hypothetical protein